MRIGWTKNLNWDKATYPPEVEDQYLVTTTRGRLMIARWTNIYWFGHAVESDWHWELETPYDEVLAWMPLPNPYVDNTNTKEEE